jgi:DHA1 family multidrug resistance protein-like MFS transporter
MPDFELPFQYSIHLQESNDSEAKAAADTPSEKESNLGGVAPLTATRTVLDAELESLGMTKTKSRQYTTAFSSERAKTEELLSLERTQTIPIIPQRTTDGIVLVDWYTTDDPANPHNWSSAKRGFITFLICAYTWVVYTGSSIYAPSEAGVMAAFGVSPTLAVLPLSLYVLAYGIGPLLWAPLCEIPAIGRNPVYIITFVVFFVLAFPTAVVNDFSGLLALRFFQGFFGSPALANGGATFSDMYSLLFVPYQLSWWVFAAWGMASLGESLPVFETSANLSVCRWSGIRSAHGGLCSPC